MAACIRVRPHDTNCWALSCARSIRQKPVYTRQSVRRVWPTVNTTWQMWWRHKDTLPWAKIIAHGNLCRVPPVTLGKKRLTDRGPTGVTAALPCAAHGKVCRNTRQNMYLGKKNEKNILPCATCPRGRDTTLDKRGPLCRMCHMCGTRQTLSFAECYGSYTR